MLSLLYALPHDVVDARRTRLALFGDNLIQGSCCGPAIELCGSCARHCYVIKAYKGNFALERSLGLSTWNASLHVCSNVTLGVIYYLRYRQLA